jgi:TM2 domain-containing membrane protein YozV
VAGAVALNVVVVFGGFCVGCAVAGTVTFDVVFGGFCVGCAVAGTVTFDVVFGGFCVGCAVTGTVTFDVVMLERFGVSCAMTGTVTHYVFFFSKIPGDVFLDHGVASLNDLRSVRITQWWRPTAKKTVGSLTVIPTSS